MSSHGEHKSINAVVLANTTNLPVTRERREANVSKSCSELAQTLIFLVSRENKLISRNKEFGPVPI